MNIHWKYILYSLAAALLTTACSKDSIDDIPESEKTSIQVTAEMATGAISAQSRAGEGSYTAGTTAAFADGKKFAVAVYRNGEARTTPSDAHIETKMGTTIVTYKDSDPNYTYTKPRGESSLLYWDDFGGYSANLDAVGLCTGDGDVPEKLYSGGKLIFPENNSSEAKEDNIKTINWSLDTQAYNEDEDLCVSGYLTDKKHTSGVKGTGNWPTCDFNSTNNAAFQHVLSKITVSLTADPTSYGGSFPSGDTKVTINGINRTGTINLATREVTNVGTSTNVEAVAKRATGATSGPYTVSFLAMPNITYDGSTETTEFMKIVVPSTISGQVNNYSVPTYVIANLLATAAGSDDIKTATGVNVEKKITLKSGVHYYINLIVKKQAITVVAQIKNWDTVTTAEENAPIVFEKDITDEKPDDGKEFKDKFTFYRGTDGTHYSTTGSPAYTYGEGKWTTTDNVFYWESSTQAYYFRALYPSDTPPTNKTFTAVATEEYNGHNGHTIYWGTTAEHTWGSDIVAEGEPVNPRTGPVKMIFYPILSKIQVNVVTTTEDNKVDLSYKSGEAKITIKNTAKTATIDLHNSLTLGTKDKYDLTFNSYTAESVGKSANIKFGKDASASEDFDYVIPQSLVKDTYHDEDAVIEITVQTSAGPLTYSTKLSNVKVKDSDTKVTEWERGKKYIYTITIKKTGIEINAQLVDWIPKEGEVEVPFM